MKSISTFALFVFSLVNSFAQVEPVGKNKVALGGYDVVSYFKVNKAVKGDPNINMAYNGITYHFATVEDRDLFKANPAGYLPQYEGYCALAIATQKKKVSINPETFKVTDGKLYLFYNGSLPLRHEKFNSLEPWVKDEGNLIHTADNNWPEVKQVKRSVK